MTKAVIPVKVQVINLDDNYGTHKLFMHDVPSNIADEISVYKEKHPASVPYILIGGQDEEDVMRCKGLLKTSQYFTESVHTLKNDSAAASQKETLDLIVIQKS